MSRNITLYGDGRINSPATIALAVGSAKLAAAVPAGTYAVISDQDAYLVTGTAAGATATSAGFLLKANVYWVWHVLPADVGNNDCLAAIRVSADGTVRVSRVSL